VLRARGGAWSGELGTHDLRGGMEARVKRRGGSAEEGESVRRWKQSEA
jgi:hypothetical protein